MKTPLHLHIQTQPGSLRSPQGQSRPLAARPSLPPSAQTAARRFARLHFLWNEASTVPWCWAADTFNQLLFTHFSQPSLLQGEVVIKCGFAEVRGDTNPRVMLIVSAKLLINASRGNDEVWGVTKCKEAAAPLAPHEWTFHTWLQPISHCGGIFQTQLVLWIKSASTSLTFCFLTLNNHAYHIWYTFLWSLSK